MTVWGKDIHKGKVLPVMAQDGQPTELYWSPPDASRATCNAFMRCKCVHPIFVMSPNPKKQGELYPIGVCFVMARALALDPPKNIVKLESAGL